jgi:hypothetical protein
MQPAIGEGLTEEAFGTANQSSGTSSSFEISSGPLRLHHAAAGALFLRNISPSQRGSRSLLSSKLGKVIILEQFLLSRTKETRKEFSCPLC